MIKNPKLSDFPIYPEYVKWEDIEKVLGKKRFKKFLKYMEGQTCLGDGVYVCDIERFLTGKGIWD